MRGLDGTSTVERKVDGLIARQLGLEWIWFTVLIMVVDEMLNTTVQSGVVLCNVLYYAILYRPVSYHTVQLSDERDR